MKEYHFTDGEGRKYIIRDYVKQGEKDVIYSMAKALYMHPHLSKDLPLLKDVVFFEYGQRQRTIKRVMRDFAKIEVAHGENMYKEMVNFNNMFQRPELKYALATGHAIEHLNCYRGEKAQDRREKVLARGLNHSIKKCDREAKRCQEVQDRAFRRDWNEWVNSEIEIPREK